MIFSATYNNYHKLKLNAIGLMVIVTTVIIGTDRDGSCIIHRVE